MLAMEAAVVYRVHEVAAAAQPLPTGSSGLASSTPTARQVATKKTLQQSVDPVAISQTPRDSIMKAQMRSLSRAHLQLSENRPATIIPGAEFGPCRTFIVFELVLDKPLIPKRLIEDLTVDLKPLLSKKENLPDRAQSAEKAVKEYHKAIIEVSQNILNKMKMQDIQCLLSESSMFAVFQEQLKFPIVNLVREKFFRSTPFASQEEFQKFLSDLFVYLVREMRQSMMVAFSPARKIDTRVDPKASHGTVSELLVFAEEAEYTGALDWARYYFQKRVAKEPHNSDAWIDLAVFCLRQAKSEEAEECLRECLSVKDSNIKA
ncbi:unnamed protein product [Schistocephalus solidus]|uniref:TPR_REGION domain-containing protein n=1 Tax=Schistocephalus solidus TaxID=70667 RepID=A0A183SFT8_SCHSO|nr:unnamed protein product [Schistocephalus solidus]